MHSIRISKPNKRIHLTLSLSTFGVHTFVSPFVSVCCSSTIVTGWWVQVTPGVTLKNYTFFKSLDLSKSNGKKKTLINANIPTSISLIIPCLLHSIRISTPNKRIHLTLSLSTFGVHAFVSPFVSVCCSSSTIVTGCYQNKQKNKKKKSH